MMRAACLTEPGPVAAIQVDELPVPVLRRAVVRAAVEVSAVNPVDTVILGIGLFAGWKGASRVLRSGDGFAAPRPGRSALSKPHVQVAPGGD